MDNSPVVTNIFRLNDAEQDDVYTCENPKCCDIPSLATYQITWDPDCDSLYYCRTCFINLFSAISNMLIEEQEI
jgi:hypothetical protein